jgi:predicted RNA methylase
MKDDDLSPLLDVYFRDASKGKLTNYLLLSKFSRHMVPQWFRPMLEDKARNDFYRSMLHSVKDKVVIDLGAGTGMWSMEALVRGAKFVYLIEKNLLLAKYLQSAFKNHPVKVISKSFENLTSEDFDLGAPEVCIHEIFSSTGLGEGVIPAFTKLWELLPRDSIELLPRYFWLEARVSHSKPMKISDLEKEFLNDAEEMLLEIMYPLRIRAIDNRKNLNMNELTKHELMFLDLKQVKQNESYSLKPIAINLTPGLVHKVYLSFKFSTNIDGPFFDSAGLDHHWGGLMVEFYVSKFNKAEKKMLTLKLNKNVDIDSPSLIDDKRSL